MEEVVKQMIIVDYLAAKAGYTNRWIHTKNEVFSGDSPLELIITGNGSWVISWLELRLGLKEGALF